MDAMKAASICQQFVDVGILTVLNDDCRQHRSDVSSGFAACLVRGRLFSLSHPMTTEYILA
jgi:hypothetical protein